MGLMEAVMVACPALRTGEPPGNAIHQHLVIHLQQDHGVDPPARLVQHRVEFHSLRDGARESIEDKALAGVRLADAAVQHGDDEVIRHQPTGLHDRLGALPNLAASFHLGPQHIPRRDLHHAARLLQTLGLGPLAGARRSQEDQVHRPPLPFTRLLRINPSYWCASRWDWICVTVSMVTDTMIIRLVPPK